MSRLLLLLLLLFTIFTLTSAKIPAVIVFGDSSVDSGNNNVIKTLLKSNFRPYGRDFLTGQPTGRFSNGKVPPDFISEAFGLKPTVPAYLDPAFTIADFATGVCFASAGTGFDNSTSDVLVSFFYQQYDKIPLLVLFYIKIHCYLSFNFSECDTTVERSGAFQRVSKKTKRISWE